MEPERNDSYGSNRDKVSPCGMALWHVFTHDRESRCGGRVPFFNTYILKKDTSQICEVEKKLSKLLFASCVRASGAASIARAMTLRGAYRYIAGLSYLLLLSSTSTVGLTLRHSVKKCFMTRCR